MICGENNCDKDVRNFYLKDFNLSEMVMGTINIEPSCTVSHFEQ